MADTLGALQVRMGFDTGQWTRGVRLFRGDMGVLEAGADRLSRVFSRVTAPIRNFGLAMSAGVTLPTALAGRTAARAAGDFEAAMNAVEASLIGIDPGKLQQLAELAQTLGPSMRYSAAEAAGAIEDLALAGMSASDILDGGLLATLRMAKANAGELGDSAALATDVMGQFGLQASDLPKVVDQVTGALDLTKFGFADMQLAISQAGGVAADAGLTFHEFSSAIAATAYMFSSGSDAGTSFKTFIQSLNPKSKEAADIMADLGISFYGADGAALPLLERIKLIREALAGLNAQDRGTAITKIWGSDAARTAIPFINLGSDFSKVMADINSFSAQDKIDVRMRGFADSLAKVSTQVNAAKVAFGQAGLVQVFTGLNNVVAKVAETFAGLPGWMHRIMVVFALAAAAVGPLTLALLGLSRLALPLLFGRLGVLGRLLAVIINPMGVLVAAILRLAAAKGLLSVAAATLGTRFLALAGPVGAIAVAIALVSSEMQRQRAMSVGVSEAIQQQVASSEELAKAIDELASAQGDEVAAAREMVRMKRQQALANLKAAQAAMTAAKASWEQALADRAAAAAAANRSATYVAGVRADPTNDRRAREADQAAARAEADLRGRMRVVNGLANDIEAATAALSAGTDIPEPRSLSESDADRKEKKDTGPSAAELAARREEMRLEIEIADASLRGDRERERAAQDRLDLMRQIGAYEDAGLTTAQATRAAEADMTKIAAARAAAAEYELTDSRAALELEIARADENEAAIRGLERQVELHDRIERHYERTHDLAEATRIAEEEQLRIDEARDRIRARWLQRDEQDRQIELARVRGDSFSDIRQMEARRRADQRAIELQREGGLSKADAERQAIREAMEGKQAFIQGEFRDSLKGGFRAALDGDFGGWFQRWMSDRTTLALEDALNNIADALMEVFRKAFDQGDQGGGKSGGGIFAALASIFGGGKQGNNGTTTALPSHEAGHIPGFRTGGSFRVGGVSGVDANLIQFRATKGEIVDIRRPGHERAGGIAHIVPSPYFDVRVDGRAAAVATPIGQSAAKAGSAGAQRALAERRNRQLQTS